MKNLLKNSHFSIFKIITILSSIILVLLTFSFYINYKYTLIRDNFYSEFNKCNFKKAENIINNDNLYLKLKSKSLNNDLKDYFSSIVSKLCNGMLTNEINENNALAVFNEIKKYNVLDSSLDKLILSLDKDYTPSDDSDYNLIMKFAIENYNNKEFVKAFELFSKIPASASEYYKSALTYINKCKKDYKYQLFSEADALASNDYYTKAIDLLSNADKSLIDYNDEDISVKINEISDARDKYLIAINNEHINADMEGDSEQTSSNSILQSITIDNINTLNIESLTSNLIYVNLANQTTYVYEGSMNDWNLIKKFNCSTGIAGQETPSGIFTILSRGDWFFSDSYGQGGKYWVQFLGDYLFHSLPYNEDQSEVLDYTLGSPASHGCIRLNTEDAKWIYDYILNGTKVIIS